ncbi:MAG: hypothetical protein U9O41_08755 [Candidatus Aerophobetes bacterium]|nr:hypothetical protein [Candidatus Aerophobetes bacterium]
MKKLAIATLIILAVLTNTALAFQNEPDGFRGLKWGDPPGEELKFLTKLDEWMMGYRNPIDKLKLGDAHFYMILYQFYSPPNADVKKFMSVALYFKDKENFNILETICKVKFGKPTNEGFYNLGWISLSSMVSLKYDGIDEEGYLALGSMPIFKQYTQEKEKKQAEEAEKDW